MQIPLTELPELTAEELRVLGCLIEKERTTPEYYPLTLNSLVTACNQKTSRDPVVDYDSDLVEVTLDALRDKRLAYRVDQAGSRTAKYRHNLAQAFEVEVPELSVLGVLMLRGPQTLSEIRTRTERMYSFADVAAVEALINDLKQHEIGELVVILPRQPGRKELRYMHRLGGELPATVSDESESQTSASPSPPTSSIIEKQIDAKVAEALADLRGELETLKAEFAAFKRQFE